MESPEEADSRADSRQAYHDAVELLLSGFDCVLNGEKAAYVSSDLTTGQRFYRLLREHGVRDAAELREKLGDARHRAELFEPNAKAANEFARRVRKHLGGSTLVITPAPLFAPGWSQDDYLGFFGNLIRTRVASVFFNRGWQYSNGCTYEFEVAVEAGIATFDADYRPLDRDQGLAMIERAAQELEEAGLPPVGLRQRAVAIRRLDQREPPASVT